MGTRISERDLEMLSAYLDGQVTPRERGWLEARLQAEGDLRVAYEELKNTRAVLRSVPRMRAPRNYTLSPRMVKDRSAERRRYPILSLASALASVLFVLVFLSDYFFAQSLKTVAVDVLSAPATESAEVLMAPAAPLEQSEEPGYQSAAPGELEVMGTEPATEEPALALEMEQVSPEMTPVGEPPAEPDEQAKTIGPVETLEVTSALDAASQQPVRQINIARSILRVVEVILVLTAVTSGIAAFILYRRQSL
jgi:hypothetical protein